MLGWQTRQPPVLTSSWAGIIGACHLAQIFRMGSGDPVPVSVLSRQALCQLSHLHILPFNIPGNLSVLSKSHLFPWLSLGSPISCLFRRLIWVALM